MTNKGDQLLVKSTTWACDDWESSFADACDISARSTVPNTTTEIQTMYLVLKRGLSKVQMLFSMKLNLPMMRPGKI